MGNILLTHLVFKIKKALFLLICLFAVFNISLGQNGGGTLVITIDGAIDPLEITTDIGELSCNSNGADGSISISVSGGIEPYTYDWTSDNGTDLDDGADTQTGLQGGIYTVVVTDGNGCTEEEVIELITPQDITIDFEVEDPTCNESDGNISISTTPEEDEDDYTYDWSTTNGSGIIQGERDQENLTSGVYNLTVTNQDGCTASAQVTLSDITDIEVDIEVKKAPSCNGGDDGRIKINSSGGGGGLDYSIDGGATWQNSKNFKDLTAGEYIIIIRDRDDCQTIIVFTLEEEYTLIAGTCIEAQDFCNLNEGQISVEAFGGTLPYTITWTSSNGGTLDQEDGTITTDGGSFIFTSAQAGKIYSFVVTDSNGCQTP